MHPLSIKLVRDLETVLGKYGAHNYIIGFSMADEPMDIVYYHGSPFWARGAATNLEKQLEWEAGDVMGRDEL